MPFVCWKATAGDQFLGRFQESLDYLGDHLGDLLWSLVLIVLSYFGMQLLLRLLTHLTSSIMHKERYHRTERQGRRVDTVLTLVRSVGRYLLYFLFLYITLRILGVDTGLLAAAGIGSFAIGFGAQSLVKDVINGFFMMFENQFSVGDYVKIDDVEGTVEATAMRVTYLRTYQGQQVILPNGTISKVINYSRGNALALVSVFIPYEVELERALEVIRQTLDQFAETHKALLTGGPLVRGVLSYSASGVEVGVSCPVLGGRQWEMERGLRLALKLALDQAGISIGYPHQVFIEGKKATLPTPLESPVATPKKVRVRLRIKKQGPLANERQQK